MVKGAILASAPSLKFHYWSEYTKTKTNYFSISDQTSILNWYVISLYSSPVLIYFLFPAIGLFVSHWGYQYYKDPTSQAIFINLLGREATFRRNHWHKKIQYCHRNLIKISNLMFVLRVTGIPLIFAYSRPGLGQYAFKLLSTFCYDRWGGTQYRRRWSDNYLG